MESEAEAEEDAMQVDISEKEDSDDDMTLDKEIEELIRHCEELHVHHHTAIDTLQTLHERLSAGTGLTIHVSRCADTEEGQEQEQEQEHVDLGDYMERHHRQTIADIQERKPTSFYRVLLNALEHAIIE
jgi:hypothetical protein